MALIGEATPISPVKDVKVTHTHTHTHKLATAANFDHSVPSVLSVMHSSGGGIGKKMS